MIYCLKNSEKLISPSVSHVTIKALFQITVNSSMSVQKYYKESRFHVMY